jgi:flavodoxin
MKKMVVSYSLTGNNEALATSVATALGADHVRITESKSRTMLTTALDMFLNRTPKVSTPPEKVEAYDWVFFVGPVWMGQIATPFRACFKQAKSKIGSYAFISISGGADGPNLKLADELKKRLGKAPTTLIDLHIADLLPPEPKPTRDDTSAYRLTERDVQHLTDTIVATLDKTIVH